MTTTKIHVYLFTTYGNINSSDLRKNDIKMNMAYNANIPIKVLFDQVKDDMDYAAVRSNPKTFGQIVMTGQQLITETCMFIDELKE